MFLNNEQTKWQILSDFSLFECSYKIWNINFVNFGDCDTFNITEFYHSVTNSNMIYCLWHLLVNVSLLTFTPADFFLYLR